MLVSSPFSSRNQLPTFLGTRFPGGRAVEVGTHRGQYAAIVLRNWPGVRLTCVDPWVDYPGADLLPEKGKTRTDDMAAARTALDRYDVAFLRTTSLAAAETVPDGSIHFVYLDGDHREHQVYQDLLAWWPKLAPGGVLAGHDFVCPGVPPGHREQWGGGVQRAVERFRHMTGLTDVTPTNLIVEEGGLPWTFYLEKP